MRKPIVLTLVIFCSGCATQAQRESQRIGQIATEMKVVTDACVAAINTNPQYLKLWMHQPKVGEKASLKQLSDQNVMTIEEQRDYLALQSDIQNCRSKHDAKLRTFAPSLVAIEDRREADADSVRVKLLHRQITWGEAVGQIAAISAKSQEAFAAESNRLSSNLKAEHQAELNRRQAAADAFNQVVQQQQIINNLNRPVTTQCNRFGNSVNCTTY